MLDYIGPRMPNMPKKNPPSSPAEILATLPRYPEPLTSPRNGPIPDPTHKGDKAQPKWKGPRPPWFEPQWDFIRNAAGVSVFDEPRRNALEGKLDRILREWHRKLNGSPMPGLAPPKTRKSVDLTCLGVCNALGEHVLNPLMADVWSAAKECVDSMGLRLEGEVLKEIQLFGERAADFACAWASQRTFNILCQELGADAAPRIRKVFNEMMPGIAGTATNEAFLEPLCETRLLQGDHLSNGQHGFRVPIADLVRQAWVEKRDGVFRKQAGGRKASLRPDRILARLKSAGVQVEQVGHKWWVDVDSLESVAPLTAARIRKAHTEFEKI